MLDRNGRIIARNKTAENAGSIGMNDVIVVQSDGTKLVAVQRTDLDLDSPTAKQLAIADNRASQVSLDWDVDVLKELATEIDLSPFFSADELEAMWPSKTELLTDEDDIPPMPVEPVSKPGDLYILGSHRLLCGDSTNVADVERLMGGQKADMVFTDIPYNVAFNGRSGDFDVIANDDLDDEAYEAFLGGFHAIMALLSVPVTYQCCDWRLYPKLYRLFGCKALIVWAKNVFGMGNGYRHQHELIVFNGVFKSRTESDLWQIAKEPAKYSHPTQKPVELPERAIRNSSERGGIVLDLFGGSGSTLIACEKIGRKCLMMELDPLYADVIVTRWENATGKKAVLDGKAA